MYKTNKILACVYAVGLGIGEAIMNWGNWQYAPLWVVDYMIVVWLLAGVLTREKIRSIIILAGGWAFSFGVMYMALAVVTSPENTVPVAAIIKYFIGLLIATSFLGLYLSYASLKIK